MKLEKTDLPKKSLPIFFILCKNELNFGHAIFFSRPQFTYLERWSRGSECTTTLSEDQVQFSAPTVLTTTCDSSSRDPIFLLASESPCIHMYIFSQKQTNTHNQKKLKSHQTWALGMKCECFGGATGA